MTIDSTHMAVYRGHLPGSSGSLFWQLQSILHHNVVIKSLTDNYVSKFFKLFFFNPHSRMFIDLREKRWQGGRRERQREKHWCEKQRSFASCSRPNQGSNPQPFSVLTALQPSQPPSEGGLLPRACCIANSAANNPSVVPVSAHTRADCSRMGSEKGGC